MNINKVTLNKYTFIYKKKYYAPINGVVMRIFLYKKSFFIDF